MRELMKREIDEDRLERLADLGRLARELDRLAESRPKPAATGAEGSAKQSASLSSPAARLAPSTPPTVPAPAADRSAAPERGAASRRHGRYPAYERRRNLLVKVGWSKKSRQEYEHKAPREVIDGMLAALEGRAGSPSFAVEELGDVRGLGGEAAPSYQVYLVLGWLREIGVLHRRGRANYELANGRVNRDVVEQAWGAMRER
jgi:hypothetical protein